MSVVNTSKMVSDVVSMHQKFDVIKHADHMIEKEKWDLLKSYLAFRLDMCEEELTETVTAFAKGDAEGVVDGLIDLMVFAIGTLDIFGVSIDDAWDEVMKANMSKNPGVKPGRPNPFGFSDLVKPEGWQGPDHSWNTGYLKLILKKDN